MHRINRGTELNFLSGGKRGNSHALQKVPAIQNPPLLVWIGRILRLFALAPQIQHFTVNPGPMIDNKAPRCNRRHKRVQAEARI